MSSLLHHGQSQNTQTFIWHSLRRPIRTRQRVTPSVMHGVGAIEIEQNQHWQTHRLTAPLGITDPIMSPWLCHDVTTT